MVVLKFVVFGRSIQMIICFHWLQRRCFHGQPTVEYYIISKSFTASDPFQLIRFSVRMYMSIPLALLFFSRFGFMTYVFKYCPGDIGRFMYFDCTKYILQPRKDIPIYVLTTIHTSNLSSLSLNCWLSRVFFLFPARRPIVHCLFLNLHSKGPVASLRSDNRRVLIRDNRSSVSIFIFRYSPPLFPLLL